MNRHASKVPFGQNGGRNGYISIVMTSASSGTSVLKKFGGSGSDDMSDDTLWVAVANTSWSSSDETTIYAPVGQWFRFDLTGDAKAYSAG